ncbi:MAG TPA: hypothetical protein VHF07_06050, partial [Nitrospiraceae bacterium]|nr:hypothetical protein [Nitrospiraceae bacterium]
MMKHYVILATFCTAVTVIPQVARAGEKPDGPSSTGSAETTTSQLDSRNLPRPEWTQVSDEVEKKKTLVHEGQPDRLIVTLKAIEGGMLQADLGDAEQLNKVELQDHDYIHV